MPQKDDPAVVLSHEVSEPTSYQGTQIIELDFPAEYFQPPPEPPAAAAPAAAAEPPLIEQITQAVRDLADRQSAVVADLEARAGSAPEAARQWLSDTANFHRVHVPNITAVADHLANNPEPALAEADGLVVGGGNTVRDVSAKLGEYGLGQYEAITTMGVQVQLLQSLLLRYRQLAAGTSPAGTGGSAPAIIYRDEVPLLGDGDPGRAALHVMSDADILNAFTMAIDHGYFSRQVFPGIQAGQDGFGLAAIQEALKKLDKNAFLAYRRAGHRLALYRDTGGQVAYRFIPEPVGRSASLLLVEYYRLTSFPTRYGVGRTIKTFSLLPGEETTIKISSYKRSSTTRNETASILDSTNQDTESEFERSLLAEQSTQDASSRGLEYHAEASAQGKASWGWGSASVSVSGGVRGSSNSSREEFAKNVSNAVGKNAARASSRRDMQINTEMQSTEESGEEQATERLLRNINVSRTLNFVFRQMNQEYVTLLHLVDVRVAFFNGFAESRHEVPLPELDWLLQTYIVEKHRDTVLAAITGELANLMDHQGSPRPDFIETVTHNDRSHLRVSPKATSTYQRPDDPAPMQVPGVIINADVHVLRTDGVVVDTFLGRGSGLDDYSAGLQKEAIRAKQLENDREEVEIERQRLALELLRKGDDKAVQHFRALFPLAQVVNQIDKAAINSNGITPSTQ